MKKIILIALCLIIMSTSIFAVAFTDLPETHWAYTNITKLVEEGVINGYPDGTYRPDGTVTRGEYLKLIMTAAYGEDLFQMVKLPGHWAMPYFAIASDFEILKGIMIEEQLDDPITRIEMVEILARVCWEDEINSSGNGKIYNFSDISEESKTYIDYVTLLGLIKGYEDETFRPEAYMTRAEVATVVHRYKSL